MRTIVTKSNFTHTYSNKEKLLSELYEKFRLLKVQKEFGSTKIAKLLNCQKYIIDNWLYFNCEPYPIKAINLLSKLDLIPLKISSDPKSLLLTKLLAFLFGDGSIASFNFRTRFAGQKKDLIKLKQDIKFLLNIKSRIRKAQGVGDAWELEICNAILGRLLYCMGAPLDDKLLNPFKIPNWLLSADKEIKITFLDTLFSNELSSPRINSSGYFSVLELQMWKTKQNLSSLVIFLNRVKMLLKEFGIDSKIICYKQSYTRKRDRKIIKSCTLRINNSKNNLYKFLNCFNFNLCKRKAKARARILPLLKEKLKV